jgi:ankyrin repeat protein
MKPIHRAAGWGTLETVKVLVQHGSDINTNDASNKLPIHYSALKGSSDVAEFLVLKGIEYTDRNGHTPRHLAAIGDKIEILKSLLLHLPDQMFKTMTDKRR